MTFDPKQLVARAIARGLVRLPQSPRPARRQTRRQRRAAATARMRRLRDRRYAAGLNCFGRPRTYTKHPDLSGLNKTAYKRTWQRWKRSNSPD